MTNHVSRPAQEQAPGCYAWLPAFPGRGEAELPPRRSVLGRVVIVTLVLSLVGGVAGCLLLGWMLPAVAGALLGALLGFVVGVTGQPGAALVGAFLGGLAGALVGQTGYALVAGALAGSFVFAAVVATAADRADTHRPLLRS